MCVQILWLQIYVVTTTPTNSTTALTTIATGSLQSWNTAATFSVTTTTQSNSLADAPTSLGCMCVCTAVGQEAYANGKATSRART